MKILKTNLVAPDQVGWVIYKEGVAEVAVKIILSPTTGELFASLPTAYSKGNIVQVVRYPNKSDWLRIAQAAVKFFKESSD